MKETLTSMGWISKSLILAIVFAAFPLLITNMAQRGVKPEVTIAWWTVGVPIGIFILSMCGGGGLITNDYHDFFINTKAILTVFLLGATVGVILNTFYGQAVRDAPNPALAIAVINSSMVFAFLLAPLFHKIMPRSFPAVTMDWTGITGTILVLMGVVMISKSR